MVVKVYKSMLKICDQVGNTPTNILRTVLGYAAYKHTQLINAPLLKNDDEKVDLDISIELAQEIENMFSTSISIDEATNILLLAGLVVGVCE